MRVGLKSTQKIDHSILKRSINTLFFVQLHTKIFWENFEFSKISKTALGA